jgi:hypothetical protein
MQGQFTLSLMADSQGSARVAFWPEENAGTAVRGRVTAFPTLRLETDVGRRTALGAVASQATRRPVSAQTREMGA